MHKCLKHCYITNIDVTLLFKLFIFHDSVDFNHHMINTIFKQGKCRISQYKLFAFATVFKQTNGIPGHLSRLTDSSRSNIQKV